jgi:hypothetical protein
VQETIERKDADAEAARVEREASDADWESRLEGAVSSAQKWTEFAERLQAEKAEAEGHLAAALADVQVRQMRKTEFVCVCASAGPSLSFPLSLCLSLSLSVCPYECHHEIHT